MQVTETLSEGLKRELSITVPAADLVGRLDKRLAELKDTVRINGFRPGKVPTAHLKRLVGAQEMARIVDEVIGESIRDVVEGRKERPALNPDVALAEGVLAGIPLEGKLKDCLLLSFTEQRTMQDIDLLCSALRKHANVR